MKKLIKQKLVFDACKSVNTWKDNSYTWGEVKEAFKYAGFVLLDTDKLQIYLDEGFDEPDNSRDPYYEIKVYRDVEETDAELKRRIDALEKHKRDQNKKDYELYLKLKKQFENNQ